MNQSHVELVQEGALVLGRTGGRFNVRRRGAGDDHVADKVAHAGPLLVRQRAPPPLDDVLQNLEREELGLRVLGVLEDGVDAGPGVRVGLDGLEDGLGGGALVLFLVVVEMKEREEKKVCC